MTANSLSAAYTDIQAAFALAMGWDRDPDNWSTDQDADFAIILNKGARQFYYPPPVMGHSTSHKWSFLYPLGEIELTPGYSTGTIAVSSGVVTGTGTVFPSWAAQGDLWYTATDGKAKRAEVLTRTGDTGLTIDTSSSLDAAASTTYTLRRHYYDLPDDFGGMVSNSFTYRRDQPWNYAPIRLIGEAQLRQMDYQQNTGSFPFVAALIPIPPTATQSSRWKVSFGPALPSQSYFLEYRYHAIPPALDGSTHVYHYGGAEHSETFIASVLDKGFQTLRDSNEHHDYFMERLATSVAHDKRNYGVMTLGKGSVSLGGHSGSSRQLINEVRRDTSPSNITLNLG